MKRRNFLKLISAGVTATNIPSGIASTVLEITEKKSDSLVDISINTNVSLNSIKSGMLGANHRYFLDGLGMWDPEQKIVVPEFQSNLSKIGLKTVRYPGGTTSNLFHWRRAIGPSEYRTPQVNPYLGLGPDTCTFGIDEAFTFSDDNGMETIYVYNFGNGCASDAADLISYLNSPNDGNHPMAELRATNGHPEPYNIKAIEIGNEIAAEIPNVDQDYWLSGSSEKTKAQLYTNGGTVTFTTQKVVLESDWRDSASISDGTSEQKKYIRYAPVIDDDYLEVQIDGQRWTRLPTLDNSGKQNVFTLDCISGEISFGDNNNGNIPPINSSITVSYRSVRDGIRQYVEAIKSVDTTVKVYMAMDQIEVLEEAGSNILYDGMVIHPYGFFDQYFEQDDITPYYYASMVDSLDKVNDVEVLKNNLLIYSGRELKPAITEYALHDSEFKSNSNNPEETALYYEGTLGAALFSASQLIEFIKMDLDYALRHSLIDRIFEELSAAPMGLYDTYTYMASAHAYMMKIFCQMTGDNVVETIVEGNPELTVHILEGEEIVERSFPTLSVLASRSEQGNYAIVLNRHASNSINSKITFEGISSAEELEIWTYNGLNIDDYNTVSNPYNVSIEKQTTPIIENNFEYTFPPHSLTAIKLRKL
ncbi:alpha-L-arabinofuranosidase C-terminal domain-containing protein [Aliivibrio fischeri]|uniref:non-reducing end alpha-L-arabinofuranosidase n=1 Tax=Aliivibrio fischeri SR5 TaxID=1088719 RepID=A0AAV3EPC8_ALIFS|nr:alpha-L-arabinofuranosidase C-terminal domain-containing protein [Aliivibrio fischeri]EHN68748.1 alpha-L-arabinofuranosidase [Aliivibrio fischeri SR5]